MCREQNKVLALNNHRKTLAFVVVVVKKKQRSDQCIFFSAIPLRRSFKSACSFHRRSTFDKNKKSI